jgi:type IV pilus assembly protein PilV
MNDLMKTKGFSLIEVLVAMVILAIALLALAGLMVSTTRNNSFGGHMTEAATFAQDKLEELRLTPWANIDTGADPVPPKGSTGINYNRNWTVVTNVPPPNDTLRTVTVTVSWNDGLRNDGLSHSISLNSAISLSLNSPISQ